MRALIVGLSSLLAAAAPAAATTYSATLAQPASGRLIVRDIIWQCGPAACQGATQEGRAIVLCQSLAKRAGRVDHFLADGRAFTASELDRCNAFCEAGEGRRARIPVSAGFALQGGTAFSFALAQQAGLPPF